MQDKKESELQLKKVSLPFTQPEVFTIRGNLTLKGFSPFSEMQYSFW